MGKVIDFTNRRFKEAEARLSEKLADMAAQPKYETEYERAAHLFWQIHEIKSEKGQQPSPTFDWSNEEALNARFLDWFFYDFRLETGIRLIELLAESVKDTCDSYETSILSSWLDSYFGVFEVSDTDDKSTTIRDVLSGKKLVISHDFYDISTELRNGDLIAGRPLTYGDDVYFSGAVLFIPEEDAGRVIKDLQRKYNQFLRINSELSVPQFYRLCGHMLDRLIAKATVVMHSVDETSNDASSESKTDRRPSGRYNSRIVGLRRDFDPDSKVDTLIARYFENTGVDSAIAKQVFDLWIRFRRRNPICIKRAEPWAAALLYAASKMGVLQHMNQEDYARQFNTTGTRVSQLYRMIVNTLQS